VARYGTIGSCVLAAIVGMSDIDPFVLSLARNGAGQIFLAVDVVAILLAASSNKLLKAAYVVGYTRGGMIWPVVAPIALSLCGIGVAIGLA
jgi:hypothetical protein